MTVFYNFSGGMESAAMLVVDLERIRSGAVVCTADTGKQLPEWYTSKRQIEELLDPAIEALAAKAFREIDKARRGK